MNAEVRRKKARLMDEVPKLCKLARKKVKILSSCLIEDGEIEFEVKAFSVLVSFLNRHECDCL